MSASSSAMTLRELGKALHGTKAAKRRLAMLAEICGRMAMFSDISTAELGGGELGDFVDIVLPEVCRILAQSGNSAELRTQSLLVCLRLPFLEAKDRVPLSKLTPLLNEALKVLVNDNEAQAELAIKLIENLYRVFSPRSGVWAESAVYLVSIVSKMYSELRAVVTTVFTAAAPEELKGSQSLKVLSLCPSLISILLNLFPQIYEGPESDFTKLLPLLVAALQVQLSTHVGETHRKHYEEFLSMQVNTLGLFPGFLRHSTASFITPHVSLLGKSIVAVMIACPKAAIRSRIDVLQIALRLLQVEVMRPVFRTHLHILMDDATLFGVDCPVRSVFSIVVSQFRSELVKTLGSDLNLTELAKVVGVFCKTLHDESVRPSIQLLSLQRLVDSVDIVYSRRETGKEAMKPIRSLLLTIFHCFIDKFETLVDRIPFVIDEFDSLALLSEQERHDRLWKVVYASSKSSVTVVENSIVEVEQLMGAMLKGLKTLVWCITHLYETPQRPNTTLSPTECEAMGRLAIHAISCLKLYQHLEQNPTFISMKNSLSGSYEDKLVPVNDILDQLSEVYSVLDVSSFRKVWGEKFPLLFESMLEYDKLELSHITMRFLQSNDVSRTFVDILLVFILDAIKTRDLVSVEAKDASALIKLFHVLMQSLSLFPDNESVLRPYVKRLIELVISQMVNASQPDVYLHFLRHLFRGIAGGRYEMLYQELLPLLDPLLRSLLFLSGSQTSPTTSDTSSLAIELCLTVPARLSSLLSVMPLMMQAVVRSLQSQTEGVVRLGLRTLDFWVVKVKHEFLYLQMTPFLSEVMESLCKLVVATPASFGHTATRILGRLGGRNRKFLLQHKDFTGVTELPSLLSVQLQFQDGESFLFSITEILPRVLELLKWTTPVPIGVAKNAVEFLQTISVKVLSLDESNISPTHFKIGYGPEDETDIESLILVREEISGHENLLQRIFTCLISCRGIPTLAEVSGDFLEDLSRHFAILVLRSSSKSTENGYIRGPVVFVRAIIETMSLTEASKRESASTLLSSFIATVMVLCEDSPPVELHCLQVILAQLSECCYSSGGQTRLAGVLGLDILLQALPSSWIKHHYLTLIQMLMFTYRDSSHYIVEATSELATLCLERIIEAYLTDDYEPSHVKLLVQALCSDLIPSVSATRRCAHQLLKSVERITGTSYRDLLEPFWEKLIEPILLHSLDPPSLTPSTRIGYLSVATTITTLTPPLVQATPQFLQLIKDATDYVYKDDTQRTSSGFSASRGKLSEQNLRIRIECIRLVSAALVSSVLVDTQKPSFQDLRSRITLALFRALMHSSTKVVEAAKEGLIVVTANETLPKELLQECLRPILVNLADTRKLNNHLLKLLEHLLELLSSSFNAMLGAKLLDHLYYFSEALKTVLHDKSSQANSASSVNSLQDLQTFHEVRIQIAIIDLFHLLPPAPRQFLTKLVMNVVNLEAIMPRLRTYGESCVGTCSPFRKPLLKFLAKYAAESVAFFLTPKNLVERTLSSLFLALLRDPDGAPIRDTLEYVSDQLIAATFHIEASMSDGANESKKIPVRASSELQLQGIYIVHILAKNNPDWFVKSSKVISCLLHCWKETSIPIAVQGDAVAAYEHVHKWKYVAECLILVLEHREKLDTRLLLTLLSAFIQKTCVDFTFLIDYLEKRVPVASSNAEKKDILLVFTRDVLLTHNLNGQLKLRGLRHIVRPIVEHVLSTSDAEQVLDTDILNCLISEVFSEGSPNRHGLSEEIVIELLKLANTLLTYSAGVSQDYLACVGRFCAVLITSNGWMSRVPVIGQFECWAYKLYALAARLASATDETLYHILDKAFLSESGDTFELLEGVVMDILPHVDIQHVRANFLRIYNTKRHLPCALRHMWSLVVGSSAHFYPCRVEFAPEMVYCMQRMGHPSSPLHSRKLALDIAVTLVTWETSANESSDDLMCPEDVSSVISFLLRTCISTSGSKDALYVFLHASKLLGNALDLWEVPETLLGTAVGHIVGGTCDLTSGLEIVQVIVDHSTLPDISELLKLLTFVFENHSDSAFDYGDTLKSLIASLNDSFHDNMATFMSQHFSLTAKGLRLLDCVFDILLENNLVLGFSELSTSVETLLRDMSTPEPVGADVPPVPQPLLTPCICKGLSLLWKTGLDDSGDSQLSFIKLVSSTLESITDETIIEKCVSILADIVMKPSLSSIDKTKLVLRVELTLSSMEAPALKKQLLESTIALLDREWTSLDTEIQFQLHSILLAGLSYADDSSISERYREFIQEVVGNSLFDRLMFVLKNPMTCLASQYWISLLVECVLGGIDVDQSIDLQDSFHVHPVIFSSSSSRCSKKDPRYKILQKHTDFVAESKNINSRSFVKSLLNLQHNDSRMSDRVWNAILPHLLGELNDSQLAQLSATLVDVVRLEVLSSQKSSRPNVVSTLVESFLHSGNGFGIDTATLVYTAEAFGSWHASVELLNRHSDQEDAIIGTNHLLESLNELDSRIGAWKLMVRSPLTHVALSQSQFGLWSKAQTTYFTALKSQPPEALESERALWEDEWVQCSKNLFQWKELYEYGFDMENPKLSLEAAEILGDWNTVGQIVKSYSVTDKGHELRYAIMEGLSDIQHVRSLCESMTNEMIESWGKLPQLVLCESHASMLHQLHVGVELMESAEMVGLGKPLRPAEVNRFRDTWRDRLPNSWEMLPHWGPLLKWRMHLFSKLVQSPKGPNFHDMPWTLIKLAEVSRSLQLPTVCLTALSSLDAFRSLEPSETFLKLKEHINLCLSESEDATTPLQMINTCDIESFSSEHKAEVFKLKGDALVRLGKADETHTAYSSAVSVCEEFGDGWLSWASFCDHVFSMKATDATWAEFAVVCYLQAVKYSCSSHKVRFMLSRVLYLLSADNGTSSAIANAFERHADSLPLWIWLLWIPQLLSGLARPEGRVIKRVLERLVVIFPQALFYSLRAFIWDKKEIIRNSPNPTLDSYSLLGEVYSMLEKSHSHLAHELSRMVEEINNNFRPSLEEELYNHIYRLFESCFNIPVTGTDELPTGVTEHLEQLYQNLFRNSESSIPKSRRIAHFHSTYHDDFRTDFFDNCPETLTDLISLLKQWKTQLFFTLGAESKALVPMEGISKYLMQFHGYGIEIPGQYVTDAEPRVNLNVMLEYFLPRVKIQYNQGQAQRTIGMLGSDGKTYHFLVQSVNDYSMKSDERLMQLLLILNRLLGESRGARQRNLSYEVPLVVPITNRIRLLRRNVEQVTLKDIYTRCCEMRGFDADSPLIEHRNLLMALPQKPPTDSAPELLDEHLRSRVAALRTLMHETFPSMDTMLSDYVARLVSSPERLWHFRKEMGKHFALSGFLTYALEISDRSLHKMSLSLSSGSISNLEMTPRYNAQNHIDCSKEPCKIRLSPNIHRFLTPIVVQGVLPGTVVAAAACVQRSRDVFKSFLYLYIRDDMLSRDQRRNPNAMKDDKFQRESEMHSMEHVKENAGWVQQRISALIRSSSEPDAGSLSSVTEQAELLVFRSSQMESIALMKSNWHPWW